MWLKQNNPKTLNELSRLADQYLAARNQKLSSKEVIKPDSARAGVKKIVVDFLLRVPWSASYVIALVTGRLTVALNQKVDVMSITDQLDTQLRATNVAKMGMKRGSVGTPPLSSCSSGWRKHP